MNGQIIHMLYDYSYCVGSSWFLPMGAINDSPNEF
jgi:hypothetical protein